SPRCRSSRAAAGIRSRPASTVRWRSGDEYDRGVIGTSVQLTWCLIPLYIEYSDRHLPTGERMLSWYAVLKVVHVVSVVVWIGGGAALAAVTARLLRAGDRATLAAFLPQSLTF